LKTGFGLYKKYRKLIAYLNLIRFILRKYLIGFDAANQFIQRVDKVSLQLILSKYGAAIGKNCDIETGLIFHNCKNYSNLKIGNNCHIGKSCFFDLRSEIIIENNVVISMRCNFITHQDLNKSKLSIIYNSSTEKIRIGQDTYIGVNSTILKGVNIESFSIIAASSMVHRNIPSFSLYGGAPAKFIKKLDVRP